MPGRVKTRLEVDPIRAAELHSAFVRETLTMLDQFPGIADVEISTDEPAKSWSEFHFSRSLQVPGDLGQRLFAAIRGALDGGRPRVLILGSDSPTLPPGHVRTLLASRADVAIGPTEDGGFYGIACRRAAPEMFHEVRWSSASVLEDTVRALQRCGLTFELGPHWFDVDTPADLERLGLWYRK